MLSLRTAVFVAAGYRLQTVYAGICVFPPVLRGAWWQFCGGSGVVVLRWRCRCGSVAVVALLAAPR